MYERVRDEYKLSTKLQLEKHHAIIEEKRLIRLEKSTAFCSHVVDELISLTFKIICYRELDEKEIVPVKIMRDWKMLFAHNISVFEPQVIPLNKDAIPKAQDDDDKPESRAFSESSEAIRLIDHQEFLEYIDCKGHWQMPNGPMKNDVLTNVIEDITQMTHIPLSNDNAPELPSVALTISMLGKKYSGKDLMAQKLASTYSMDIIRIENLIKDAVR